MRNPGAGTHGRHKPQAHRKGNSAGPASSPRQPHSAAHAHWQSHVQPMAVSSRRNCTPTLATLVLWPTHRRTSMASRDWELWTSWVNVGRVFTMPDRSPQGGEVDGEGVGLGVREGDGDVEMVGVGVLVGVGVGVGVGVNVGVGVTVGVGVGVGVRVGVLDGVREKDGVGVLETVAEGLGLRDGEGELEGDREKEGVTEGEGEKVGVTEGVGQSCASFTDSSPMGPSSSEPRMADMATHATLVSHWITPGLGVPSALRASWAGMLEYGRTENSRWGRACVGPVSNQSFRT